MGLSVLTVARTLPIHIQGGMEEAAWNLARALARLGVAQTIITTAMDGRPKTWQEDDVTVHEIDYVPPRVRRRPVHRWWPRFGAAAARHAKTLNQSFDVVHVHSFYANGVLEWPHRPPIVATLQGTAWGDYVGGSREKLRREAGRWHPRRLLQLAAVAAWTLREARQLRRVDAVVSVSRPLADQLIGMRATDPRLRILPNGVNADEFPPTDRARARRELGLPTDVPLLLFLGRVEEYKGVGRLLRVLADRPDLHLAVAGDGSFLEEARRRASASHLAPRVHFLGPVTGRRRALCYAAADLVCLPSQQEGQPLSLLEALATGVPVGVSRPWLPEALLAYAAVHADPAVMVDRGLELAARVDPRAVRDATVRTCGWHAVATEYLRLFQRLTSSPPTP